MRKTISSFCTSRSRMILTAGLLVGSADILLAFINAYFRSGATPDRVLRFVASGVFGGQAYSGGPIMIVWGLLFHFFIAMAFATFFFLIYPKIKWLSRNLVATGILYGLFTWSVMNLVVVRLSNTPPLRFPFVNVLINMAILVAAIGLPLSLLAHRFYSYKNLTHEPR